LEQSKDVLTKSQKKVWGALCDPYWGKIRNNKGALVHIERSQKQGKVTDQLAEYILELAIKVIDKKEYKYRFNEDLIQEAAKQMLVSVMNFKLDKSNNAFAYLTVVCHSSMIRTIHKENKQRVVQEELMERAELGLL